jgi:hypothetical protein
MRSSVHSDWAAELKIMGATLQGGNRSFDNMGPHFRKKLIIVSAAIVFVVVVGIVLLIPLSNYIIKHQMERALGTNFSVERISLSWGNVGVYEPRFIKDGQTVAYAKRIILKAHFLTLLKPGFSISSAVLEEPSMKLEVSQSGEWGVPIVIEKKQESPSASKPGPLYVNQIVVKNGTLFFQDHRLQDPNSVEVQKINVRLDNVSVPFKNEPSKFTLQLQLVGKLISGFVTGSGTFNFESQGINVKLEGQNLALLDTSAAGPVSRVQSLSFTATSEGIPAKPLLLSDLVMTKPYVHLESDRNGNITSPLPGGTPKQTNAEKQRGTSVQIEVKNLKIAGGELLYLDGKIARRPYPVRLTDIALNAETLSLPPEGRHTTYQLTAHLPGSQSTGVLTSSGKTDFKTLDTNGKVSVRDLDLTSMKPYLVKQGDADVSRGFLDLSMDLSIKEKMIYAPTHAVIRDLAFVTGRGVKDQFLGIPRSQIVKALETNNHRIGFDFILEGNLENPQFHFLGGLVKRFTIGLAKSLGLSVLEAGETVIIQGGRGIWGIGKGLKEMEKELQKRFK